MKIRLTFDINSFSSKLSMEDSFKYWLYNQADSLIEIIDPNTDELVGEFSIGDEPEYYKIERLEE